MFYFPGSAHLRQAQVYFKFIEVSFLIQKFPDQRLLGTSPKRIAAMLRLSSPFLV